MTTSAGQPPIWTLPDIGRELETHDPEALVRPLVCAGLLYRLGDFVFASPTAFKMVQMTGHIIYVCPPRNRRPSGRWRGDPSARR